MKKMKTLYILAHLYSESGNHQYLHDHLHHRFSITEVTEVKDGGWSIVCHPAGRID